MIKCMVATKETQGQRASDFCNANEDEIVRFGPLCCSDIDLDGGCGCARSLIGIESLKGTTTMKTVELDMTQEEYYAKMIASARKTDDDASDDTIIAEATEVLYASEQFGVGYIIEYRGGFVKRLEQKNEI
ncbi:hypothetical protein RBG61_11000 [Paludicola sp. MB14-C6]|uniref:DUF7715 family protein n=1 Tax=Paludihabitans sp. MB14-C6 TaxID=3070656 RepID=UPI0027DC4445|nr:hypothetical protein [Paludicola sp. MB14-C6]WMJ22511.1 hypothetical protein RBG61_11000 [Paludicola sp. MB14-C6]